MNREEVEAKVIEIVAEQLGIELDKVQLGSHIENELGAESIDSVDLLVELEGKFDIEIKELEADCLFTVGDHVDCVCRKLEIE